MMNHELFICDNRHQKHYLHKSFNFKQILKSKVRYVKKVEEQLEFIQELSSDDTKGDSDISIVEIVSPRGESPKVKFGKSTMISEEELNRIISGKGNKFAPKVKDQFRKIEKTIPMPSFLND